MLMQHEGQTLFSRKLGVGHVINGLRCRHVAFVTSSYHTISFNTLKRCFTIPNELSKRTLLEVINSVLLLLWRRICTAWWRHQMETFSALLALCAGNSPASGEFPAQRPVTRSFDVFFDLRLNKRLSKQSWGWWFETPSCLLWRHGNDNLWQNLDDASTTPVRARNLKIHPSTTHQFRVIWLYGEFHLANFE